MKMKSFGNNVYILGAGFSVAAGLPVINNFMTKMRDTLELNSDLDAQAMNAIELVMKERSSLGRIREKIRIDLDNIEELFSLIDASEEESDSVFFSDLEIAIRKAISATLLSARKVPYKIRCQVAESCMEFANETIPNSHIPDPKHVHIEVDPYSMFASLITHKLDDVDQTSECNDTVITFNYDTVLEDALHELEVIPDYVIPCYGPDTWKNVSDSVRIIKLHGSINWTYSEDPSTPVLVIPEPLSIIQYVNKAPLLLPPSWKKNRFIKGMESLWNEGIEAIRQAHRVFIIGYSMPISDAYFRYFLAAGLRDNHTLRKLLIINKSSLAEVCNSFLDDTYFNKRLEHYGGTKGKTFEQFLVNANEIYRLTGRGSLLLD